MRTVEDIEKALSELPPDQLAEFRTWFETFDAARFDDNTAYVAVNRMRIDDLRPSAYRTHDGGKTWRNVTAGIPEGAYVNSVKEDPQAKGLLYAATELRVYVSFSDGAKGVMPVGILEKRRRSFQVGIVMVA